MCAHTQTRTGSKAFLVPGVTEQLEVCSLRSLNLVSNSDLLRRANKLPSVRRKNSRRGGSFSTASRLTKPAEEHAARPRTESRPDSCSTLRRPCACLGVCFSSRLFACLDAALVNSFFRTRLTAFVAFNVCYEQRASCDDVLLRSHAALML